jgi:hypothetical protein
MPNRWLCLAIVAFWLSTTGWLFWTDVLPDLTPGQPPPFTIDLLDEVNSEHPDVIWTVYSNGRLSHSATTWVRRPTGPAPAWVRHPLPSEAFELGVEMRERPRNAGEPPELVELRRLHSVHFVTQRGDLIATRSELDAAAGRLEFTVEAFGEVIDGQFVSRCRAGGALDRELPPVPVSRHGSFLNPLHPVTRIRGVRPGQEWDLPLVDPLADALAAASPLGAPERDRRLHARVLPELQELAWRKHRRPIPCLVIEYAGKRTEARTWIEPNTGLVLRQETALRDDRRGDGRPETLVLHRESDIDDR